MDKELLDGYMKAIEEELRMMQGKNITTQVLNYLDSLMCTYKKLDKFKHHEEMEKHSKDGYEMEDTNVDDNLYTSLDEYKAYIQYKKEYKKSNRDTDLKKSHDELEHFLSAIFDVFAEIENNSRDNMEERSMIKKCVKSIYQLFD